MFQVSLGRSITDAWLIILQIVLIQSVNYFLLILLCVAFCLPFGFVPTLEQLFSYKAISVFSLFGWINIVIWLLDGFIGGFLLFMIVRRSKKCMDFTITFHVIHLLLCIIYKAFPVYWEWYVCVILHSIIMTLVGEFSCYWREQREINLPSMNRSSSSSSRTSNSLTSSSTTSSALPSRDVQDDDDDEESAIGDPQIAERTAFLSNTTKEEKAH